MTDASEIEKLKAANKALEARVEQLETGLSKAITASTNCDLALKKFIDLHGRYHDEAFDRIMNIEVKVFPNLVRDLNQLHRVIGEDEGKAINPLDHRES